MSYQLLVVVLSGAMVVMIDVNEETEYELMMVVISLQLEKMLCFMCGNLLLMLQILPFYFYLVMC